MSVDIGGALTRACIKNVFLLVHPEDRLAPCLVELSLTRLCMYCYHNSINFNVSFFDQFGIFRYRTSAYHARQTIIMHVLFKVMASVHASEQFWNGKCSHCPVGPFWNILKWQKN